MRRYLIFFVTTISLFYSVVFAESFVKEKAKKTKKVSHSRCQEECITPLARLMEQSYRSLVQANGLVAIGNQITLLGNEFLTSALEMQNIALEATVDLLDEDRDGGQFAIMTLNDLQQYCKQLEKMSSDLALAQQEVESKKIEFEKMVSDLRVDKQSCNKKCL